MGIVGVYSFFARIGVDGIDCLRISIVGLGRKGCGEGFDSMVLVGGSAVCGMEYVCDLDEW